MIKVGWLASNLIPLSTGQWLGAMPVGPGAFEYRMMNAMLVIIPDNQRMITINVTRRDPLRLPPESSAVK